MNSKEVYERLEKYAYYIVVFIISILATSFLPFIGSSIDGSFAFPSTWNDWVVYIVARVIISLLNVGIFFCFVKQAEVNVRDNPKYIEANNILSRIKAKNRRKPRSPNSFLRRERTKKSITILMSSIGALFALTSIILRFDLTQFLVYVFVISIGVIFGYLTMKKHEFYRTEEYYDYAKMIEEETLKNGKENI